MPALKLFSLAIACLAVSRTGQGILVPVPKGTCELEFDGGIGNANEPVWTYDAAVGGCKKAFYGGYGGNDNRFPTPELCGILCFPENICNTPFDAGRCKASIPTWTFNSTSGTCEEAFYGGCGGNSNRFDTKDECTQYCRNGCIDVCSLKFDGGICKAYMPVWTFNPDTGICEEAIYGGCGGNGNRFATEEDCIIRCELC